MSAEQRHSVPFQPLRRMQRGNGDALRRWDMLRLGATVQLRRDGLQGERLLDHPQTAERAQQWLLASASRSSATLSNAASDSQRSRSAPPPSGGC